MNRWNGKTLTDPHMHLLVTRPIEQANKTARLLEKLGHKAWIEPLLHIEPISSSLSGRKPAGLIVTSSNGASGLERNWPESQKKTIPVLVTGETTAQAVHAAGFSDVEHCSGAALDLIAAVPDWIAEKNLSVESRFLYPCAETYAQDIPGLLLNKGIRCDAWPVYRSIARSEFSKPCKIALKTGSISAVLLYSKRTAHTFVELMCKHKLPMTDMNAFVLSREIYEILPKEMKVRTKYPDRPDETSLMKLLAP